MAAAVGHNGSAFAGPSEPHDGHALLAKSFVTLLVITDPVGVVPVFLTITADATVSERRRAAWQAVVVAAVVIATFLCDQPLADGGTDQGPSPTELFVASLAACVAFYARRFLARHHLDAAGLRSRPPSP